MDVVKEVRKAYITLITNAGYVVFDRFLPDNVKVETYIILSDQDDQRQIDKCGNGHISSIILSIVHRTLDNSSGVEADNIADVLIPIIENDGLVIDPALTLIKGSSRKMSDTTDSGTDDTVKVYRRILRFQHIIKEN